jgi:hypothetical protein
MHAKTVTVHKSNITRQGRTFHFLKSTKYEDYVGFGYASPFVQHGNAKFNCGIGEENGASRSDVRSTVCFARRVCLDGRDFVVVPLADDNGFLVLGSRQGCFEPQLFQKIFVGIIWKLLT